ncbi:MAG: hypothetical protein KC416_04805 [Myxococcales bacterium]|nr:hypothetical protein [Myxococcales bacterium]
MRVKYSLSIVCLALLGCGESHTKEETSDAGPDSGISFDGGAFDGAVDAGPSCGNGVLEAGEQCDDGNGDNDDQCTSACERTAFCGDGNKEGAEVCDDGNNASGDGCRADCGSDETCGNGIRDVAKGELCDDMNMVGNDLCSADCKAVTGCGNGNVDTGETCDDTNTDRYDGCGPDCLDEAAVVVNSVALAVPTKGCDYSGDGKPDNAFSSSLGIARGILNSTFIEPAVAMGQILIVMDFRALDDKAGVNDSSVSVAWFQGVDADQNANNNFSGNGTFRIPQAGVDGDGNAKVAFTSSIENKALTGGPEDVTIPFLPGVTLVLRRSEVQATTKASGGSLSGLDKGLLCGAISIPTLALIPNLAMQFGGESVPCDGGGGNAGTLLDQVVGGSDLFILQIAATQPDADLDGDGLEYFEVDADGPFGCQPVISACVDGDGTRVEGRDCYLDPSITMADGFSAALDFTAVGATIVGVQ